MLGDTIGDGLAAVPLGDEWLALGDEPALVNDGLSGDAAGDAEISAELAGDDATMGGMLGVPWEPVGDAGGAEDEDGDEAGDSRAPAAIGQLAHSGIVNTVSIGSKPQ